MGWVAEETEFSQLSRLPLDIRIASSPAGVIRYLTHLNREEDLTVRRRIGRGVLSLLQEDFVMIPLAPSLGYSYSPLEIQFDDNLTYVIDLFQNMSQLVVERH